MRMPIQSPPVMPYEQRPARTLLAVCQCGAAWMVASLPAVASHVAALVDRPCPMCDGFAESIKIKAI